MISEILISLGMTNLSEKFRSEGVDTSVVTSASDDDLIRLGVRTIGDRVRLREACRRTGDGGPSHVSTRMAQEERSLLFTPSTTSRRGSSSRGIINRFSFFLVTSILTAFTPILHKSNQIY